jgi:hypothetical protein
MNADIESKLAPPGAGLPMIELQVARLLFALDRWRGNRELFNAQFEQERERIRKLVGACQGEAGGRRVLIARPRGLEDSSRYWSVWMTLDHLRIIHASITRVIGALAKNVVPPGKASTAAVKPSPLVTASVVAEYEESCDALLAVVAASENLKTKARYAHPWFGPLDAAGWHALAPRHLKIHRVQIERILEGIRN